MQENRAQRLKYQLRVKAPNRFGLGYPFGG